jgi:hypothetical protein
MVMGDSFIARQTLHPSHIVGIEYSIRGDVEVLDAFDVGCALEIVVIRILLRNRLVVDDTMKLLGMV